MRKDKKINKKSWKIIARIIVLSVFIVGTLTGCAKTAESENRQELPEKQMPGVPILTIETAWADCYDVTGKLNAQVTYDTVSLEGNGFETAAQSVLEWNERDIGNLIKIGKEYTGDKNYTASFASYVECTRMDSSVISLKQEWYGADWYYQGVNFDVASGKRLVLADIVVDEEKFKEIAAEPIIQKLKEVSDADVVQEYEAGAEWGWISEYIDISSMWYLDAAGIILFFYSSKIEPYLYDSAMVRIPYEDVAECMKPEYCGIHGAGVAHFPVNEPVRVNLSENASSDTELLSWDTLMLAFDEEEMEDEWELGGTAGIIVNDRQEDIKAYYWMDDAYLLSQISGETYLLFDDVNLDHHGCITYIYDITNGEITKKDECGAWIVGKSVNVRTLILGEIVEVFGTYYMTTPYSLRDESARFVRAEVRCNDLGRSRREIYSLRVVRDLPVVIDGEKTTLAPGSRIIITAIDDSKVAYFEEVNSGIEGEIHYTGGNRDEEGPICVDGVEESYYFEYLPYSG
ncbi:MAG: hypothetical protein NC118_12510 [Eubacterium sp.]|nr:hypothetical protein [Eubacterium sp.]